MEDPPQLKQDLQWWQIFFIVVSAVIGGMFELSPEFPSNLSPVNIYIDDAAFTPEFQSDI
jgi:amino acid transporter